MTTIDDHKLYQLIADIDYLPEEKLKEAQINAEKEQRTLYESLIAHDIISDKNLGRLIADYLKLPLVTLSETKITPDVLHIVPKDIAQKYEVIAFGIGDKSLKIATTQPETTGLFDMLAKKVGATQYDLYYATKQDIEQALQKYRDQLDVVFQKLINAKKDTNTELPMAQIVDAIIEQAYTNKASDVHIEPTRTQSIVRFRVDGVLRDVVSLPRTSHDQIVTRLKVLARLRTDEHLSPQDGRLHVSLEDESIDIRISVVPIISGEKVVLRILASHYRQFGLTDLGMSEADLDKLHDAFSRPYGMVLSTGPTGSGKTTTMYAVLKILNVREKNIATIEDPVEYEISGINQIQANTKTQLTFANGLRSILRQDPDIMFVGEIRDEETADIAINSAMTGHLVLSTLHTNDAATTLPRLIDMNIEPFLVASTVNAIIGQRLVRKVCDHCKVSIELKRKAQNWEGDAKTAQYLSSISRESTIKFFGSDKEIRLYRGKGCSVCHNTGYNGRLGIFEILTVTPAIQEMITNKVNAEEIAIQAQKQGMTTMQQDGLSKVAQGLTTLEEITKATRE